MYVVKLSEDENQKHLVNLKRNNQNLYPKNQVNKICDLMFYTAIVCVHMYEVFIVVFNFPDKKFYG